MDSNSRGRFRRDYTDGLIRGRQEVPLPPTPPPAKAIPPSEHKPPTAHSKAPAKQTVDIEITLTKLILGAAVLAIIVGGIIFLANRHTSKSANLSQSNQGSTGSSSGGGQTSGDAPVANNGYFPSNITKSQVSIPVYYPVSLPSDYKVSGFSVIKKDVLYYVVTSKTGQKYYVTTQPLPSDFDFVAFAKKFPQPDKYNVPIGSALVGIVGTNLIGSIQTNQNSWIILNSANTSSQKDMETITRAFQQVQI